MPVQPAIQPFTRRRKGPADRARIARVADRAVGGRRAQIAGDIQRRLWRAMARLGGDIERIARHRCRRIGLQRRAIGGQVGGLGIGRGQRQRLSGQRDQRRDRRALLFAMPQPGQAVDAARAPVGAQRGGGEFGRKPGMGLAVRQ